MKRKKIMTIGLISLITICVSLVTVEASTWTSTGRINNLPTYGKVKDLNIYAQFKKIVALSNLIQRIYHNDIRNMLP